MTLPKMMKAAQVQQRGAAKFEVVELPVPQPGPGQVLIQVESAGVNFSDVKRRRGDVYPFETRFPFVPGGEIAGTVVGHGAGVSGPPVGTKVFALAGENGFGGYAQFAVSYAPTVVPVPQGLSLDVASVLTVAGTTAKVMLETTAKLKEGERLLVSSAGGGVGGFALQLARRHGARQVIALVGDASKREAALTMGAHDVVVTSSPRWPEAVLQLTEGQGVDVALEGTGGEALEQTLRCLAPFGRLVVFGAATGVSGTLSTAALERLLYAPASNQTVTGFNIGSWFQQRPEVAGPALGALMVDVLAGRVRAPSITTMPLESARLAHEALEQRRSIGKLVIKPWA